jgi:hypothetical protein
VGFKRPGRANHNRYSGCGGVCRGGTTDKQKALDKYCEQKEAYCYVGIATDEKHRLSKERKPYKIFPLVEWKMTEEDCLTYCRIHAMSWNEQATNTDSGYIDLYDILDRVSCWCCANKNLWELHNIWKYLPQYWDKLKALQLRTNRNFKKEYSVFELEKRFESGYIPKHIKRKKKGE